MDILSKDVLSSIGDNENPSVEAAQSLRDILEPICDASTTARDLLSSYRQSFISLAKHAIKKPDDFPAFNTGYWGKDFKGRIDSPDKVSCYSFVEKLHEFLSEELPQKENSGLLGKLEQAHKKHAKMIRGRIFQRLSDQYRLEDDELARQQKQRASQAKRTADRKEDLRQNFSGRDPYKAKVTVSEDGVTFIVHRKSLKHPLLTRADWMQFVQKIDPQEAKASDVSLFDSGLRVVFSKRIIEVARSSGLLKENKGYVMIDLPNRRANIDLNNPHDAEKLSFSM